MFQSDTRDAQALGRTMASIGGASVGGDRSQVSAIVRRFMERNPQVVGAYVGYDANAFDGADAAHKGEPGSDEKGRFGPYWNTISGKPTLDPLVDQEISDYWNDPKKSLADSVIEPYLYDGLLMTSYTSPVQRDGKFVGIGGVDVSLKQINTDVSKLRILGSGYGLLVSNGGTFVAAPDKGLIGKKTLGQLADAKKDPVLARAAKDIAAGRSGQAETTDPSPARRSCSRGRPSRPASGASSPPSRSPR